MEQARKPGSLVKLEAEIEKYNLDEQKRYVWVGRSCLNAAQIIAHHNALLDGFDAGSHAITVTPADEVTF